MIRDRIIRAWKDPEYRLGLSEEDRAELPENPAGAIELTDEELDLATGGHIPSWYHPSQRPSTRPSSRQPSYSARPSQSQSSYMRPSYPQRPSSSWRTSRSYPYRR